MFGTQRRFPRSKDQPEVPAAPATIEKAHGDRLERLRSLKDRYDPTNFFRLKREHRAERDVTACSTLAG